MPTEKDFTPALGNSSFTPLYDAAIGLLTREDTWRSALLEVLQPTSEDRILDVGCGTGSLAVKIKHNSPGSEVHGIDPDASILQIAEKKAKKQSVSITFHQGFLTQETTQTLGRFSAVVSSLVFHQTPMDEKRNLLSVISKLLLSGGKVCIADYGLQRTKLMKTLFRRTVQAIDGVSDTQPNADGCLPILMKDAGFLDVSEVKVIPTATGSISIYSATVG